MRVLVIGGTGMSGPFIAKELQKLGHEVLVYHRGVHESPFLSDCEHIHGERSDRSQFEKDLNGIEADALVDMLSMIDADSQPVIAAFRGRIGASVHISSGDVYRDLGGPDLLREDSPLREGPSFGKSRILLETRRLYQFLLMRRLMRLKTGSFLRRVSFHEPFARIEGSDPVYEDGTAPLLVAVKGARLEAAETLLKRSVVSSCWDGPSTKFDYKKPGIYPPIIIWVMALTAGFVGSLRSIISVLF